MAGPIGCKSKKPVVDNTDAEKAAAAAQLAKIKAALQDLIDYRAPNLADLAQKERELADIKAMNIQDGEVLVMIKKAEYNLQQERERLEKLAAEQEARDKMSAFYGQLDRAFQGIANAGNLSIANTRIQQALGMFSSKDSPVIRIIHREGSNTDYDEPTTILKYLNYLKDHKTNPNNIENVELDANGKIKLLELIKR